MKNYIKKYFCAFAATAMLIGTLCACADKAQDSAESNSNNKEESSVLSSQSVNLDALREKMHNADESLPAMSLASSDDENGADLFAYLADYDYENVKDYFFSYAEAGTAEEIAVIELFDAKDASECADAVKQHVDDRIIMFETYDPTQVSRCEKAVVFHNDVYVVLIICDNSDAVKDAFYQAFE